MEEWKIFGEEKPEHGRRVAYYRNQKNKFGIGKFHVGEDEDGNKIARWVTEYSVCHEPCFYDRWIYMPPLMISKEIL
jgi:hypothetical protein